MLLYTVTRQIYCDLYFNFKLLLLHIISIFFCFVLFFKFYGVLSLVGRSTIGRSVGKHNDSSALLCFDRRYVYFIFRNIVACRYVTHSCFVCILCNVYVCYDTTGYRTTCTSLCSGNNCNRLISSGSVYVFSSQEKLTKVLIDISLDERSVFACVCIVCKRMQLNCTMTLRR